MHRMVLWSVAVLGSTQPLYAQGPAESRPLLTPTPPAALANTLAPGVPKPDPRLLPAPVGQGSPLPPALHLGATELHRPAAENLITFDPRTVELHWVDNRWHLHAGGIFLKDFGRREADAREALRLVRDLQLTQLGSVGTPQPVMEYWLANGQAPQGALPSLHLLPLDRDTLHVESIQGQWCVRNARQTFFNFGPHADEARRALEIIQHHGFTQIGYIGQPMPAMIYFVGQPTGLTRERAPTTPALVSRTVTPGQSSATPGQPPILQRPPFTQATQPGQSEAQAPSPSPFGRQLVPANASARDLAVVAERVPFDWRRVEVRQNKQDWILAAGGYTLANFGSRQVEARQALTALQYYRFTEQQFIGPASAPALTYFLAFGQAPRGLLFGVPSTVFRPESLRVQRIGESYVLSDGEHSVWSFGDKAEAARQALQIIQHHKFDHLCHIGGGDSPAMTFFVRAH